MTEQWEVMWKSSAFPNQTVAPPGWEPFAGTERGIWLRRRVSQVADSTSGGIARPPGVVAARRKTVAMS